jgi:hypothetical protein
MLVTILVTYKKMFCYSSTMNRMTSVIFEKGDFMKKQLTVALGLAVIATPVLASKARLEALGEDNFGSYYINDNRNIFLNPAKINENKDLATFEFGASSNNTSVGTEAVDAPRAEGGVIKSYGNMAYGLHFGNSTGTAVTTRGLITGNTQEVQPLDLFVGGDAGVKWGANLTYEAFDGTVGTDRISSNALRTRVGAVSGDLEGFAQVSVNGDVKNRTGGVADEVEGKSSYYLGAGYMMNGTKLFVDYKSVKAEYGDQGTTASDWELNEIRVGAARSEKLNDKATMFAKAQIVQTKLDNEGTGGATATQQAETNSKTLPLTMGLEYDAASWLVLRTSVSHNIWGTSEKDPTSGATTNTTVASTAVRAGATLKFGEFSVDGLVSTDANGDGAPGAAATTAGGNGNLRTDNLMSRVSMTYRF